jgi:hypothetical protein
VTHPLRRVFLALACLALCAASLVACGGGDDKGDSSADQVLQETFGNSATAIENGRLNVDFRLDPEGLLKLGGLIGLKVDGPFAAPTAGRLPRFDVDLAATLAGQNFGGGVLSTGRTAFVKLDDRMYRVDDPFVGRLRKGLGSAKTPQAGLKALGLDPLRWIRNAKEKGDARIAGVETTRVGGDVNVARLLEDLDRLLTKAGGSQSGSAGSLLTPALRTQIADAVTSAKADVWTGAKDRLLRQIAVVASFKFEDGKTPIPGLDGGKINLRLRLDDVNKTTVNVTAPKGARPLSRLTGGSLNNFIEGIGAGLTSGSSGLVGGPFVRCITGANGKTVSLVRCISKLSS